MLIREKAQFWNENREELARGENYGLIALRNETATKTLDDAVRRVERPIVKKNTNKQWREQTQRTLTVRPIRRRNQHEERGAASAADHK